MGKNKKAAYSKREEEKANRIVKGLFIGLIVLALVIMVGYAMYGLKRKINSEVLLRLFSAGLFYILKRYGTRNRTKIFSKGRQL